MFNFGFSELIVIGALALIFIGPKELPEVARVIGRLLNEFRRATGDLTGSFTQMKNQADDFLKTTYEEVLTEEDKSHLDMNVEEHHEDPNHNHMHNDAHSLEAHEEPQEQVAEKASSGSALPESSSKKSEENS